MENRDQRQVTGIKIRSLNIFMFIASLIFFVAVFWTTYRIAHDYRQTVQATENHIAWEKSAHEIHVASDFLTEEARLYTQTLNPEHAANYFEELFSTHSREKALENISSRNTRPEYRASLEKAIEYSDELTHKEIYAIRLIAEAVNHDMASLPRILQTTRLSGSDRNLSPEGKINRAREIMFNSEYAQSKKKILQSISKFISQTLGETRHEQQIQTQQLGEMLSQQRFALVALFLLNAITFLMIIILIIKPLQVYAKCIQDNKMFELLGAYEFKNLALTYNNIFAIKELNDRMLRHKAEHDQLTGLYNRAAFESIKELMTNENSPIGLILIDVDKFKQINDTYGHTMGDRTLRRVAILIQHAFRSNDLCFRLGGDEFGVIVKGSAPGLNEIIRTKVASINETLLHPDDDLPATSLSVGVAFSAAGFQADLYPKADKALYRVKEAGRCGCAFYDETIDGEISETYMAGKL